ncbi:ABC transporter substrate-binding protein [Arthrobacter sp. AZCC_0090]|uniref:ABC transporter substrate-binding protein n=1 Tax=Arthrobacter sp. AZCC_0090 TaxID=2735881 RepID=UPI00161376DC|nr:ABC transporter substrate-binding protein [Arthrobacter sp. AZCC_0090]MBB6405377.1 NitT/TauT family transport system substrate-binding protein [Arthrobacter sp. AZCC_0090]
MKSWFNSKVPGAVAVAALTFSATACGGSSATDAGGTITVSYSEEVADELPLWIADEAGYFKEQGLNVKLASLASDQGFPALVSGQTQLASIGGSQIVSGVAQGAEVKSIATLTPVFPYELWSKEKDMKALKGKKIGVTSSSGSVYIATLAALKEAGMSAHDVNLIPLGSVTNVNNALLAGTIDAAVSHPPASAAFKAAGFNSILNLAERKVPNINVGIATTDAFAKDHADTVTKFLTALKKAFERERSDEVYSTQLLKAHLKEDNPEALKETYDFYAKDVLPQNPAPTVEQLKSAQDELSKKNPDIKNVDLSKVIDTSFVNKVWGK